MSQVKASHRKWSLFRVDNWFFFLFLGPAAAPIRAGGRRYASPLAIRSALRFFRFAQKTRSGLTATAAQRWAMARFARRRLRRLFRA